MAKIPRIREPHKRSLRTGILCAEASLPRRVLRGWPGAGSHRPKFARECIAHHRCRADVCDIDHVVALANAWCSGAGSAAWSTADRLAYANDPEVLLSTDAGANRTKGDKGLEAWKPPNHDYWCEYARRWIWIKSDWDLTVNSAEKSSLRQMLETCGAG